MSDRYYGGLVTSTDNLPADNFATTPANGVWTMQQAIELDSQSLWPTAGLNPPTYWFTVYQGPLGYTVFGPQSNIIVESNGDIVFAGYFSPNSGPDQGGAYIAKMNYQGTLQWQKSYKCVTTYSTIFNGRSVRKDSSGDYVISLYDQGAGSENTDVITVASDGSSASENFQIGNSGFIAEIILDSTGTQYIMAGYTGGLVSYYARFNSSGAIQASNYGRTSNSRPYGFVNSLKSAKVDSSNSLYAQWANIYEGGYVKYNSSGGIVVSSMIGGGGYASGVGGMCFENGSVPANFYATGYAYPNSAACNLFKVSAGNGTSVSWSYQITNCSFSMIGVVDSSNTYLYMMTTSSSFSGELVLIKIATSNGAIQWGRRIQWSGGNLSNNGDLVLDETNSAIVITANPSGDKTIVIRIPLDGSGYGQVYGDWQYYSFTPTTTTAQGSWASTSWTSGSSPVNSSTTITGAFADVTTRSFNREAGP